MENLDKEMLEYIRVRLPTRKSIFQNWQEEPEGEIKACLLRLMLSGMVTWFKHDEETYFRLRKPIELAKWKLEQRKPIELAKWKLEH